MNFNDKAVDFASLFYMYIETNIRNGRKCEYYFDSHILFRYGQFR